MLPEETLPRERLFERGVNCLSEVELLSLVMGCAGPIPASLCAEQLLRRFGSLPELGRCVADELSKSGLGPARAARVAAALELGRRALTPRKRSLQILTPSDVFRYARPRLCHLPREVFHVLLLDRRHRLIADRRVAEGGVAACALSPRDIFESAVRECAPAVLLVHNHPSGDPTPSQEDLDLTQRLLAGARVLGISLVDHVVVADEGFTSLVELGCLQRSPGP